MGGVPLTLTLTLTPTLAITLTLIITLTLTRWAASLREKDELKELIIELEQLIITQKEQQVGAIHSNPTPNPSFNPNRTPNLTLD